jgi:hypothetical protein
VRKILTNCVGYILQNYRPGLVKSPVIKIKKKRSKTNKKKLGKTEKLSKTREGWGDMTAEWTSLERLVTSKNFGV